MKFHRWVLSASILSLVGIIITVPYSTAESNNPPIANDDTYMTEINTPLIVPVPGVLANDNDPDGNALTSVLWSESSLPPGSKIMLNTDGSFTFIPTTDFNGVAMFSYKAYDGIETSNESKVFITVGTIVEEVTGVKEVDEVIGTVEFLAEQGEISPEHVNALVTKLEGAIDKLEGGNIGPAINKLQAFINQVDALVNSHKITEETGDLLIIPIQLVIDELENL